VAPGSGGGLSVQDYDSRMIVRTLGGLHLDGETFSRPKPLLVLCYVALEGRQPRRHLADLFFGDTAHPLQSLAVALSRLRQVLGDRIRADERTVEVDVPVDSKAFLSALERGDLREAEELYRGPFLEGVQVESGGVEVEEWLYGTREFLADQLREARLRRAEREAGEGRLSEAGRLAEAAWHTPGAGEPEAPQLLRAHAVLLAADRPLAARVAAEARSWGIEVDADANRARAEVVASQAAARSALPTRDTPFVGRDAERRVVAEALLDDAGRVVTLVGPGGVGKTTLSLQLAHDLVASNAFTDGVHFVSLENVTDGARVPGRVAHALGQALDGPEAPQARLARALRGQRLLIVLDNAEQVADGVAETVLEASLAPSARWLVTSREPLRLHDERVVLVEGLALPPEEATDPATLLASPAVTLFVQRARRVQGPLDDAALPDVARICRAVGGWPLPLELAASLTRVMTPGEVADELEHRLDLLALEARDVPDRHQSVVHALESSWARLNAPEREAWARLTVFRGGFTRDAAEAVTGVGVARLARLVDHALVRHGADGRFELHPLVRRFGSERLTESGEAEATAQAQARHYLARLAAHQDDLRGSDTDAVAARLAADHANQREAWLHAVRSGDDEAWSGAALAFGRYMVAVNRYREGVTCLAEARERARVVGLDHEVLAAVALYEGACLARVARFDDARVAIQPAVMARDPVVRADAHEMLAHQIEFWSGRYAAAGRHLREAEAIFRELEDRAGGARCTFLLANIAWVAGAWDECHGLLTEAREAFRGLADLPWEVITTAGLGVVEIDRGDFVSARRHLERALQRAEGLRSEHLRATVEVNLANARLHLGDTEGLGEVLQRAAEVFERVGDDPWVVETSAYAAVTAASRGASDDVLRVLRTGLEAALRIRHAASAAILIAAVADVIQPAEPDEAEQLRALVSEHPDAYATTRLWVARRSGRSAGSGGMADAVSPEALVHPGTRPSPAPARAARAGPEDPLVAAASAMLHDDQLPSGRSLAEVVAQATAKAHALA
jgi:predicted ATPase